LQKEPEGEDERRDDPEEHPRVAGPIEAFQLASSSARSRPADLGRPLRRQRHESASSGTTQTPAPYPSVTEIE
jgi:hypothetical protein